MKAELLILGVLHRGNFHPYEIKRRLRNAMIECYTDVDVGSPVFVVIASKSAQREFASKSLILRTRRVRARRTRVAKVRRPRSRAISPIGARLDCTPQTDDYVWAHPYG
jgi:hypothetical protein